MVSPLRRKNHFPTSKVWKGDWRHRGNLFASPLWLWTYQRNPIYRDKFSNCWRHFSDHRCLHKCFSWNYWYCKLCVIHWLSLVQSRPLDAVYWRDWFFRFCVRPNSWNNVIEKKELGSNYGWSVFNYAFRLHYYSGIWHNVSYWPAVRHSNHCLFSPKLDNHCDIQNRVFLAWKSIFISDTSL